MAESDEQRRLRELDARITAIRKAQEPEPPKADHNRLANHAWRMVTELVAGIVLGLGIGLGLDWLFGTMPLFLVLFVLLGLVAGVRVMMRTAQELQPKDIEAAQAAEQNAPGSPGNERDSERG